MSVDELKEYVGKLAPEEKDRDWLTRDIAASAINLLSTKQPAQNVAVIQALNQ